MNLIEILLLLAFVFFPLIQALLGKMRGETQEELPPEPEETQMRPPVGTIEPAARDETREEGWSSSWSSWPTETFDELSAEEVVTEDEAEELIAFQKRREAREAPEATRVSVPVVSMEPLQIDRAEEHRRFRARFQTTAPPPPSPPRAGRLRTALRRPSELRRAIVLAEVLGPPRSMQPTDRPIGD